MRILHPWSITSAMSITSPLKSNGGSGQVKWSLSFPRGLGGRTGGIKVPLVNGPFVPRNEGCVQGEVRVSGLSSFLVFGVPTKLSGRLVTAAKPFSHRGRAVTKRRRMW